MLIISFIVHQSDSLTDLLHTLTTVTLLMCYNFPSSYYSIMESYMKKCSGFFCEYGKKILGDTFPF